MRNYYAKNHTILDIWWLIYIVIKWFNKIVIKRKSIFMIKMINCGNIILYFYNVIMDLLRDSCEPTLPKNLFIEIRYMRTNQKHKV